MDVDHRSPLSESNVVYLATCLGKEEPTGHRCDRKCHVEHVWANLYRCKLSNVTHVCDKNCNQRILYDNHTSVCRVSRHFFPLSAAEQEAVRGVRRKRESESIESCSYKRRQELFRTSPSAFESSFKMVVPVTVRFNSVETFMDTS